MTLLALLRHAETQWSQEKRIQGRSDVPLCDEGRATLRRMALPAEWRTVRAISSPLRRCVETASLLGLSTWATDSRLAEMSWGKWEGARLKDLRASLGERMRTNEELGLDFTPPDGESPRQAYQRVSTLLVEVAACGNPVLAISHRGVIRSILAHATGWDMRGKPPLKLDWSALHVFELDPDGGPTIHDLNIPLLQKSTGVVVA